MITLKVPEQIAADIMVFDGAATELDLSDDCIRFIEKLMRSKMTRQGNAKWYEVSVSDDEIIAVIEEVVHDIVCDLEDRCEAMWVASERQSMRRYQKKVIRFIEEHSDWRHQQ